MDKLAAGKAQSEWEDSDADLTSAPSAADVAASRMVARVRWLMIISGLTTLVAIAAVIGVIGYRLSRSGGSVAPAEGIVVLPKGASVIASSATEDRLTVTLDIGGITEIRIFDVKTLKEIGRIRFATEP
jgi:hypothetical protein